MKILSITTSSSICGIALLEDTTPIKEIELNNGLTHSQNLLPIIKELLDETNYALKNIDLLVCDIGPGSFTGIRIGIATIKAFADSLNIKTIGVNSLNSLNYNVETTGIVCSLIDAKKDNVYCQLFENNKPKQEPSFENIDTFLLNLKSEKQNCYITFVGDGSLNYKEKIINHFPNCNFSSNNDLSATNVGIAGFYNYKNGTNTNIEPLYLRKSSAEQKLENV